ncbi:hypothetical protein [Gemmobacter denitrificans]|uniref:Uncharacterized protein n=1 Tax=Gemmobacter denitrificans TaxID=3123040 RepID=A0ABU8BSJ6_9RHOB
MQAFLKCDADGCDHREDVPEITADMIGKPCPKCGANLLTEADYREGMRMKHFLEALEKLGIAGSTKPDAVPVSINPHAGEINIKIGQAAAAHRGPLSSDHDTFTRGGDNG